MKQPINSSGMSNAYGYGVMACEERNILSFFPAMIRRTLAMTSGNGQAY